MLEMKSLKEYNDICLGYVVSNVYDWKYIYVYLFLGANYQRLVSVILRFYKRYDSGRPDEICKTVKSDFERKKKLKIFQILN